MATLRFIGQPLATRDRLGADLISHLGHGAKRLRVLVAWAKVSGLARIELSISSFRTAGGHTQIILGADANGATWEGLEAAKRIFDEAYLFHDPGVRTFHPKVYILESEDSAVVWIGSSNLTRGGLFQNYEADVALDLDLSLDDDADFLRSIDKYYDWFLAQTSACQALTNGFLTSLHSDPGGLIQSERIQNRRAASRRSRPGTTPPHFGAPITGLPSAPPAGPSRLTSDSRDEDSMPPATSGGRTTGRAVPAPMIAEPRFFKRLSSHDVSLTGSPGQIIIPIGFLAFFPPLVLDFDKTAAGGSRQSDLELPCDFYDGAWNKRVVARAILYEPAATHPRPNPELRFTFRDRDVLFRLTAGDYLEFGWGRSGRLVVNRRPPGSFATRFDWIP